MDSFAFSYELKENKDLSEHPIAIMNFNLWAFCDLEPEEFKLDIGFKIKNVRDVKKLCLYIPFEVSHKEIVDLGKTLCTNNKILGAVFNEAYSAQNIPNTKWYKVIETKSENTKFYIYSLDIFENIQIDYYKENKGTFLNIDFDTINSKSKNIINDSDTWYFRFRIQSDKLKEIIREYPVKNRFFETIVYSTYMVDFRLNNMRSMDETLIEKMDGTFSFMKMESIHFLLMTKVDVDVDSNLFNRSARALEDDIWEKYVYLSENNHDKLDNIIAYHTAHKQDSKSEIESWEFFTKMKIGKCTKKTIFCFLLVTVAISFIADCVSSGVSKLLVFLWRILKNLIPVM